MQDLPTRWRHYAPRQRAIAADAIVIKTKVVAHLVGDGSASHHSQGTVILQGTFYVVYRYKKLKKTYVACQEDIVMTIN